MIGYEPGGFGSVRYRTSLMNCDGFIPEETRLAVKRGAALLDVKLPGWWQRVDLEVLQLASTNQCVLGQLFAVPTVMPRWKACGFSSPEEMAAEFHVPRFDCTELVCEANYAAGKILLGLNGEACIANGFLFHDRPDMNARMAGYAALDVAWMDLIRERQADGAD
jgi:hypothetical protein